ncbi:DNA phosphorothioation-dependent restriction protein DptG [Shewanella decolorationis]|uniref:DNA phosphorothioation-dependent restriction protein DptG n=1 Tax=Shewanella decolorationis TaxID=256839 RepID=UPI0010574A46|nr:DNA phosphorothioation-dependent restriction protein DptG [Shewanella decolorationis]
MTTDKFTMPVNADLPQTAADVPNKNSLNSYLPIRTKGNEFDWSAVIGLVLQGLLRKKVEKYEYEQFVLDCEASLKEKLGEEAFWDVLKEMYFDQQSILDVSPELLLFRAQKSLINAGDSRIASMFTSLAQGQRIGTFNGNLNFLEREILQTLRSKMKDDSTEELIERPYLPFLSAVFRKDLSFLASRPKYLLSEFEHFLSFYGFTYTAQLALSLPSWRSGEKPSAKPLYFIMDHERASNERAHVKNHGFGLFKASSERLFPMLTMLELLQRKDAEKRPLWEIAHDIAECQLDIKSRLEAFAYAFKNQRQLDTEFTRSDSALDWLDNIIKLAMAQFNVGERLNINKKYVQEVEKHLAANFIQSRGRSGRVLVLNQDHIILLTNLVVGEEDKLRFHDLLEQFKLRGIFVDKQTEQELIKFYERIGNVERMSDSGDAVYVRKTI